MLKFGLKKKHNFGIEAQQFPSSGLKMPSLQLWSVQHFPNLGYFLNFKVPKLASFFFFKDGFLKLHPTRLLQKKTTDMFYTKQTRK